MKRDMELVRSILKAVESASDIMDDGDFAGLGDFRAVSYHVELLIAHGLIDGKVKRDFNHDVTDMTVLGLTWDGQDYLDAMRDDRVWKRAKKALSESIGSTTLGVVKEACTYVAIQMFKEHIGI